ncbi:hypothetical protein PV371_00085 [Streptomyces sp. TX20-6-3]|uniref:hypothetical protein n=1 Tax=Streptomyces sp. TX20-6-3 TaxID=3028705 RepID=UPI0029B8B0DF|nr:hypothetical protein [Streptomyces sp. TX20-6-3]MDX2558046.1 hypothetical protein [Streptomyces sp. TX20-6-3]
MSAHTSTRVRTGATGVDTRLPWWALALPAVAFVALLMLMTGPGEAHAAVGAPGVGGFLERIQQTLSL